MFFLACSFEPIYDCSKDTSVMSDKELDYCADYLSHRRQQIWLIEHSRNEL